MTSKPRLALCYDARLYRDSFAEADWQRLANVVDIADRAPLMSYVDERAVAVLEDVDILITGWDAPLLDAAGLANLPRLRMISHLGATVKAHHSPAVWQRGVRVSSAVEATAYPVIEFTIAAIVFAGKQVLARSRKYCMTRTFPQTDDEFDIGLMGQTIGIVGASRVGLPVIERLRDFDVEVLVYDPFLSREHARGLGAEKIDDLDDLVLRSSIVSIHAPITDKTINMLRRAAPCKAEGRGDADQHRTRHSSGPAGADRRAEHGPDLRHDRRDLPRAAAARLAALYPPQCAADAAHGRADGSRTEPDVCRRRR